MSDNKPSKNGVTIPIPNFIDKLKLTKRDIANIIVILVSISSLFVSALAFNEVTTLTSKYQYTLANSREYDLRAMYEIEYISGTDEVIEFPYKTDPLDEYNEDGTLNKWTYTFSKTGMSISSASPFTIYLKFQLQMTAYDLFVTVDLHWYIKSTLHASDNKDGIMTKVNFNGQSTNGYYKEARLDVTNHLWKTDVPDQFEATIVLKI